MRSVTSNGRIERTILAPLAPYSGRGAGGEGRADRFLSRIYRFFLAVIPLIPSPSPPEYRGRRELELQTEKVSGTFFKGTGHFLCPITYACRVFTQADQFGRAIPCCARFARHPAVCPDAGKLIPSQVRLPEAEDGHQSLRVYSHQRPSGTNPIRHEYVADCNRCNTF